MKKILMVLASAGISYLLNNKEARQKLISKVQSITSKSKNQAQTNTGQ
jgi:hypothetical protein